MFIARIVDLVPKLRVILIRFHGVFARNSAHCGRVTPAKRGERNKASTADAKDGPTPTERRAAMTWAQRLKRVFNIDIETCKTCGGQVKIIACIEDPAVVDKILTHLDTKDASRAGARLRLSRAPPQPGLFGSDAADPAGNSDSCATAEAAGSLTCRGSSS